MTTLNQATEAVYARFVSEWGTTSDYVFEGEPEPEGSTEWVRLSVRGLGSEQISQGAVGCRRFRRNASVFVQVFTPANKGRQRGDILSETALDIFEAESFSDLDFIQGDIRESGVDGKWLIMVVEVLFNFDEIK